MDNYIIYDHISPSGKHYIGQTCRSTTARWGKDGKNYLNRRKNGRLQQPIFAAAINKYGWDNFEHKVLFTGLTKQEADMIEQDLIFYYKKEGLSYNITGGGGGAVDTVHPNAEKHLKDFEDGYTGYKKWYEEAHREEIAARKRAYYVAHKEEIAAREKVYREANKEKKRAYRAQYYIEHKAEIAEKTRLYDHQCWINMDPEKKYISYLKRRKAYKELPEDERAAWIQQQVRAWKESRL